MGLQFPISSGLGTPGEYWGDTWGIGTPVPNQQWFGDTLEIGTPVPNQERFGDTSGIGTPVPNQQWFGDTWGIFGGHLGGIGSCVRPGGGLGGHQRAMGQGEIVLLLLVAGFSRRRRMRCRCRSPQPQPLSVVSGGSAVAAGARLCEVWRKSASLQAGLLPPCRLSFTVVEPMWLRPSPSLPQLSPSRTLYWVLSSFQARGGY